MESLFKTLAFRTPPLKAFQVLRIDCCSAIANELLRFGWTWGEISSTLWQILWQHRYESIAFTVGLELGAFNHYTADWLVSSWKQRKEVKLH